jgi:hypothetical protein
MHATGEGRAHLSARAKDQHILGQPGDALNVGFGRVREDILEVRFCFDSLRQARGWHAPIVDRGKRND